MEIFTIFVLHVSSKALMCKFCSASICSGIIGLFPVTVMCATVGRSLFPRVSAADSVLFICDMQEKFRFGGLFSFDSGL